MARAARSNSADNYHEFRKRVKDQWYHIRLLESLWTPVMEARESSLKELETWLGDDHNLVLFREKLEREPEKYGGRPVIDLMSTLAERRMKVLRRNALSLGERLYQDNPASFVKRMSKLWNAWQDEPDSMKESQKEQRSGLKKQPGKASSAKSPARKGKTAAA